MTEHKETKVQEPADTIWSPVIRFMSWLGSHELGVLVSLAFIAGGIWLFWVVAVGMLDGETTRFDERFLLSLRTPGDLNDPIGPHWIEEVGRDLTALGGTAVLSLISVGIIGHLLLMRQYRMAALVFLAIGGGWAISLLLKSGFARPRPDLVPQGAFISSSSFPSGHAMLAATTYLTLAALLARVYPRRRVKAYLLLLAVLLTIAVGFSRVYLGVHWPTDVIAGWAMGTVWAMICYLIARRLQQTGQIEQEGEVEAQT